MAHDLFSGAALTVHIAVALMSFGTLALSGLYASWGQRLETQQNLRDVRRFFSGPNWGGRTLWAVPATGAVAQWLNHGGASLDQAWLVAATACWALATFVAVGRIWPAERRIRSIAQQLDEAMLSDRDHPLRRELAALCRPVVAGAVLCDLIFVVALALMILQPGK